MKKNTLKWTKGLVKRAEGLPAKGLPVLTSQQAFLLALLTPVEDVRGVELREAVNASLERGLSAPAFYQMMSRIEESGWVEGNYNVTMVNGTPIKERRYRITDDGRDALSQTIGFYDSLKIGEGTNHSRKRSVATV